MVSTQKEFLFITNNAICGRPISLVMVMTMADNLTYLANSLLHSPHFFKQVIMLILYTILWVNPLSSAVPKDGNNY